MSEEKDSLHNNLKDIRLGDPVYDSTMRHLMKQASKQRIIPKGFLKNEMDRLLAGVLLTDTYYLHYFISPFLENDNSNDFLKEVLDKQRQYFYSDKYQRAHSIALLDHYISLVYSFAFAKKFFEIIKTCGGCSGGGKKEENNESSSTGMSGDSSKNGDNDSVFENFLRKYGSEAMEKAFNEAVEYAVKIEERANKLKSMGLWAGKTPDELVEMSMLEPYEVSVDEVLDLTGKLIHSARLKSVGKTGFLGSEYIGYGKSRNVFRSIARDIALPDDLFLYKFSQGLTIRLKSSPSKGVVYLVIDKSGSMIGEKTVWARSIALYFLVMSRRFGFDFRLLFFDYNTYRVSGDLGTLYRKILSVRSGGGTSISTALLRALREMVDKRLDGTIILITDGEDHIPLNLFSYFKKYKSRIRLITVGLGGYDNDDLVRLSEISGQYLKAEPSVREGVIVVRSFKKQSVHSQGFASG